MKRSPRSSASTGASRQIAFPSGPRAVPFLNYCSVRPTTGLVDNTPVTLPISPNSLNMCTGI
jgi:hypothetical protein